MSEQTNPEPQNPALIHANLRQLAAALREADHLAPETQQSLASLLDELGQELNSTGLASANTAHLAEAVSEVARSLHEQRSAVSLDAARNQLEEAAAKAEVEAPVATGVVYRFIDVLSSIGI